MDFHDDGNEYKDSIRAGNLLSTILCFSKSTLKHINKIKVLSHHVKLFGLPLYLKVKLHFQEHPSHWKMFSTKYVKVQKKPVLFSSNIFMMITVFEKTAINIKSALAGNVFSVHLVRGSKCIPANICNSGRKVSTFQQVHYLYVYI